MTTPPLARPAATFFVSGHDTFIANFIIFADYSRPHFLLTTTELSYLER